MTDYSSRKQLWQVERAHIQSFQKLADYLGCDPKDLAGLDLVKLVEPLRLLMRKSGWKGFGPNDTEEYYCEHCGSHHKDYTLTIHTDDCPVSITRSALSQLPRRKK